MNSALKRIVLPVLLAAVASPAHAGNIVCSGTVEQIAYHQPGLLMIRLSSMNVSTFFCSTDSNWAPAGSLAGVTTPGACKTLYATFLAAKLAGGTLNNVYFDGDQVPTSCNTFPNWTKVNLRYFDY